MKVHISRIAPLHYATRDHLSTSVHDRQLNRTPEENKRKKKYTFKEVTDKYSVYN